MSGYGFAAGPLATPSYRVPAGDAGGGEVGATDDDAGHRQPGDRRHAPRVIDRIPADPDVARQGVGPLAPEVEPRRQQGQVRLGLVDRDRAPAGRPDDERADGDRATEEQFDEMAEPIGPDRLGGRVEEADELAAGTRDRRLDGGGSCPGVASACGGASIARISIGR